LAGREALKLGLIKRVGSGQSISIWEDNWLPNSVSMKPMGRLKETGLFMVDELLTVNNGWNEPLIHDLFFALDWLVGLVEGEDRDIYCAIGL
jgi:hypothetical protein